MSGWQFTPFDCGDYGEINIALRDARRQHRAGEPLFPRQLNWIRLIDTPKRGSRYIYFCLFIHSASGFLCPLSPSCREASAKWREVSRYLVLGNLFNWSLFTLEPSLPAWKRSPNFPSTKKLIYTIYTNELFLSASEIFFLLFLLEIQIKIPCRCDCESCRNEARMAER